MAISILDLTAGQIAQIEQDINLPLSKWDETPSTVDLYCRVLAAHTGDPIEKFRAMTARELLKMVELDPSDETPGEG